LKATAELQVIPAGTGVSVRQQVRKTFHAEGSARLISYLKLELRTDKVPTLAGKQL